MENHYDESNGHDKLTAVGDGGKEARVNCAERPCESVAANGSASGSTSSACYGSHSSYKQWIKIGDEAGGGPHEESKFKSFDQYKQWSGPWKIIKSAQW